jgi:hypothetical protein
MKMRISMRKLLLALESALLLACGVVLIPGFFYKSGSPLYHRIEYIFSSETISIVSLWIVPFLVNLIWITFNRAKYPSLGKIAVKEIALFICCAITAAIIFFLFMRLHLLPANNFLRLIREFLLLVSMYGGYLVVLIPRIVARCCLHRNILVKIFGAGLALIFIVGLLFALGGALSMVSE